MLVLLLGMEPQSRARDAPGAARIAVAGVAGIPNCAGIPNRAGRPCVLGKAVPGPLFHPTQQPGADPAPLPLRVNAAGAVRLVTVAVLGDPAVGPGNALRIEADDGVRRYRVIFRLQDLFQVRPALEPDGLLDGGRPGNQAGPRVEVAALRRPPGQPGIECGPGVELAVAVHGNRLIGGLPPRQHGRRRRTLARGARGGSRGCGVQVQSGVRGVDIVRVVGDQDNGPVAQPVAAIRRA